MPKNHLNSLDSTEINGALDETVSERVIPLSRFIRMAGRQDETNRNFIDVLGLTGRWLLASDMASLFLAFLGGGFLTWVVNSSAVPNGFQSSLSIETFRQLMIFLGLGLLAILWMDTRGHYRQRLPYWETAGHMVAVASVGFIACGFIEFAGKIPFSRLWLASSWVLFGVLLLSGRSLMRRMLDARGLWQVPTLVVGDGPAANAALHALKGEAGMGFTIVRKITADQLPNMEGPNAWHRLMTLSGACHILLALDSAEMDRQRVALKGLTRERVPCSIIPPWLGMPTSTLSLHHFPMHDVMLLHDTNRLRLPLPCFMKRSFDLVASGMALLALSPLFLIVGYLAKRDGGPAFFIQNRVGRNGKLFGCYKFRSMRVDAEEVLEAYLAKHPEAAAEWQTFQKLKNDVRITSFGHFIRRTSIDELPQLINVFLGHMSLVGPRPIMQGQEKYYGDDFIYYESVRPGITGPWQVSGRNKLTFNERVELEACYARNWSFWIDIVILLKTPPALLAKDHAF